MAYLGWIGVQLILAKSNGPNVRPSVSGAPSRLFRQGFITSMANPFAVVFFGALFPQFIDRALPVLPQLLILGLTYLAVDGTVLMLWGWLAMRAATALRRHSFGVVNKICGALMIGAAGLLGSKDFQPVK